jgi:hypothetical protein
MRHIFKLTRYSNKVIVRIGRLLIKAGWYSGEEPVLVTVKCFEWFAYGSEIVILLYAQVAKAVLYVSWIGR